MGCFHSTARRRYPGYDHPMHLASQTAFSVSEVEALFELFKTISGSVVDDGFISKVLSSSTPNHPSCVHALLCLPCFILFPSLGNTLIINYSVAQKKHN
ncbi:hypothetical protein ACQJBY_053092 [Aegilops geniculata]